MSRRDEILEQVKQVPSLPVAAIETIAVLQKPSADIREITRVINHDPGLAANILKLANSALFGARIEAKTVDAAIVRLGTRRILDLVISSSVKPIGAKSIAGYDLSPGELWKHSVAVACCTEELASELGITAPETAFTAGLLIDIGKSVLGTQLEIDGKAICAEAFDQEVPFEQAERHVLGIDHAEVGACLLEHWNLPESLVSVVRWHHDPERCPEKYRNTVNLVHAADQICTLCGLGTGMDGSNYQPCEKVLEDFKITPSVIENTLYRVVSRMEELADIMGQAAGSI